KSCEQVQEQAMRLTPPYPMDDRPRAHIQGSRQVAFLVSPRGQDFHLGSFGHPLVADFGQQMDIQLVGKEQRCRGGQVFKHETDPGQLLHALGVVIFGGQLGALPDPTQVVQPAAHRLGRDLYAPARLDLQGQRGTAPARATPPTCTGHGLKDRQHGALQARSQYPQPRAAGIFLTRVVKRERARPVRLHHPINARTRTEEHGGNLAGGAARGTQQQQVQGQQVPIAGPAQFCQHAGLLSHWNIYYRRFRHSRTSMIARSVWQPSIYQRVRLCANLLCFDLEQELGWMYETLHKDGKTKGRINYTVWSDIFSCSDCGGWGTFLYEALDPETKRVKDSFPCPHCGSELTKTRMDRLYETYLDPELGKSVKRTKRRPVLINYNTAKGKFEKQPDKNDLALLKKIEALRLPPKVPTNEIPFMHMTHQRAHMDASGITHIHHFYLPRAAQALGTLWTKAPAAE